MKVRVAGFGVSIDGFGAGADHRLDDPLGKVEGIDLRALGYRIVDRLTADRVSHFVLAR